MINTVLYFLLLIGWMQPCKQYKLTVCGNDVEIQNLTTDCVIEVKPNKDTCSHPEITDFDLVSSNGNISFTHYKGNKVTQAMLDYIKTQPKGTLFIFSNVHFKYKGKDEKISGPWFRKKE